MLSFGTVSNRFFDLPCSFVGLRFPVIPSLVFVVRGRKRMGRDGGLVLVNRVVGEERCYGLGVWDLRKSDYVCGFVRRCSRDWDREGDLGLEAELLEFMKNSENPDVFPSKKQLIDAGRLDLVDAIAKQGGWLSLGWDLDDDDKVEEEKEVPEINGVRVWDLMMTTECDNGAFRPTTSSSSIDSSCSASASGRSLENTEDDSGIEGILSRLEKERNMNFGFGLREKGNNAHLQSNDGKDVWPAGNTADATVFGLKRSNIPASVNSNKGIVNHSRGAFHQKSSLSEINGLSNSFKPDAWRTWSIQKARFSDDDFEAGEISVDETNMQRTVDSSKYKYFDMRVNTGEPLDRQREMNPYHEAINHNHIRSRIQNLELELSSVLQSIRSNADEAALREGRENTSEDLQKLHDAWEFQENEIMNAQNRLRSIRAKLAVLEGKMALAIIDAQKVVEEKQKRINDAQRALRLLRTACIVWPNSASEVLLAGSFDGWATQRKMQKSSTGIFSLSLKLYPGRYEIKFIVDGEWKIDPLRPIVHNGGHENNLLIIT